jgi:MarR family transcriptional repressor of emrRAB
VRADIDLGFLREASGTERLIARVHQPLAIANEDLGIDRRALDDLRRELAGRSATACARRSHSHYWHPVGGAALGPLLDQQFAVHGLEGVHVADAAAFPTPPRATTALPTLLLAHACTDHAADRRWHARRRMSRARTANLLGALASAIAEPAPATPGRRGRSRDAALVTLAQWPVESLEELRRALALSHSATVRLVDALVAHGLAERHSAGSGPAVTVKLTATGIQAAEGILAARRARLEPLVAALSKVQQTQLDNIIETLLASVVKPATPADWVCRLCDIAACPQNRCPVELAQAEPEQRSR